MSTNLTVTDLFCGAGGSSSGAELVPGVRVRMAANHWALAVETHAHNLPHADHDTADISQADPRRYPYTDILWASPECFTAGHLVTTARGQVPIEEVAVGDFVLTHRGRWRRVRATMGRAADTVIVRGGGHYGIETTTEHPFYSRSRPLVWKNEVRQYRRVTSEPVWTTVADLKADDYLAAPITFDDAPLLVPHVPGRPIELTSSFWWVVGRWLGDGSLRFERNPTVHLPLVPRRRSQEVGSVCIVCGESARVDARSTTGRLSPYCSDACKASMKRPHPRVSRGDITISCGHHEADELAETLAESVPELTWHRRTMRTATTFTTAHIGLVGWLMENFGVYAHGKTLPSWVLTMAEGDRRALLNGYVSADGNVARLTQVSSVSRALAVGIRLLALTLGELASLRAPSRRTSGVIEGRRVNMRPLYSVAWTTNPSPDHARTATDKLHRWFPVREIVAGRRNVPVFNLSVEDDESYVVEGVVVHNCTQHSQARGKRRADQQPDLFGEVLPSAAAERSRATMFDVLRFAEVHRYRAIVVENVIDVRDWILWPAWVTGLDNLGYDHTVVYLNSMFAQQAGAPAPQSRDRLYVVAWRRGERRPNLERWTRPAAWCPRCDSAVRAVQAWKNPDRPRGRYRQQYLYRCPTAACHIEVYPGVLPAAVAIDWTLAGERIGDRARPLAAKTVARIEAGLRRYARPIHLEAAGNTFERRPGVRAWPVDEPLKTMHTTASKAVACPPLLTPAGGTWNDAATSVTEPFRTRTTRDTEALVVPAEGRDGLAARPAGEPARTQTARLQDALVVPLRNNGVARPADEAPAPTVAAAGNHHALVMRNMTARGDQGQMSYPPSEPMRTVLAEQRQSLIRWDHLLVPYYGTRATARRVDEPGGTVTTVDRTALIGPDIAVDDCTFRMLEPHEIQAAMAFDHSYTVLGNKRERVRQLGNAVTPPAARDLIAALVEAITGEEVLRG